MDFSPTEDELAVAGLASQVLGSASTDEVVDLALWARLGDAGLLGIALPEQDGGAGYGHAVLALLAEEVGRTAARVPVAAALAGAARPVARHGSDALRARLLPDLVAGRSMLTCAFTESFTDEPLRPRTRAVADGTGWRLTGQKTAVPLARQASAVLVPASTDTGEVVVALVAPDAGGVELHDEQTSTGEPAATMVLTDVAVSAEDVLAPGALQEAYEGWVLALCATQLGLAGAALRMAAGHTSTREQFGRPLATFQAVAVRLGRGYIDVEALRSTTWQALHRLDNGLDASEQVATAAFWAAEAGERVLSSAVHLHGGLGVDTDFPLHRWFLAAKGVELSLGGAGRQLERLGDVLTAGA